MRTKKLLENLAGNLNGLHERLVKLESSAGVTAGPGPLEGFAIAAVNNQAAQLGAVGDLIVKIAEAGTYRAAQALGKRRAATARRDHKGRMMRPACRLCDDPNIVDPTVEEIDAHTHHRKAPRGAVALEHRNGAVYAHIDEREVQTNPQGEQQVECPNCGPKAIDPEKLN